MAHLIARRMKLIAGGLERKVPDGIERNGIRAWLVGYDEAKRLWPTEKDREWFNP